MANDYRNLFLINLLTAMNMDGTRHKDEPKILDAYWHKIISFVQRQLFALLSLALSAGAAYIDIKFSLEQKHNLTTVIIKQDTMESKQDTMILKQDTMANDIKSIKYGIYPNDSTLPKHHEYLTLIDPQVVAQSKKQEQADVCIQGKYRARIYGNWIQDEGTKSDATKLIGYTQLASNLYNMFGFEPFNPFFDTSVDSVEASFEVLKSQSTDDDLLLIVWEGPVTYDKDGKAEMFLPNYKSQQLGPESIPCVGLISRSEQIKAKIKILVLVAPVKAASSGLGSATSEEIYTERHGNLNIIVNPNLTPEVLIKAFIEKAAELRKVDERGGIGESRKKLTPAEIIAAICSLKNSPQVVYQQRQ